MFPGPLRAFYEAVRCGSIRKASESLGMAPSSISRQILILERQMGASLFDRTASGVSLTHAGKLVADYARLVILDFDGLRAELNGLKGMRRGLLRVVSVEGAVSQCVYAISAFQQEFPNVQFHLRILPAPKVVDAIKIGEADIGVTFCLPADMELRHEASFSDPIVLVVSPAHALAAHAAIPLQDVLALQLAVPESAFNIRQVLDQASRAVGHALEPKISSDSFTALKEFARCGVGASVMARLSVSTEAELGYLKTVPIDDERLRKTTLDIITLKKRHLPSHGRAFTVTLTQILTGAAKPRSGLETWL